MASSEKEEKGGDLRRVRDLESVQLFQHIILRAEIDPGSAKDSKYVRYKNYAYYGLGKSLMRIGGKDEDALVSFELFVYNMEQMGERTIGDEESIQRSLRAIERIRKRLSR